MTKWLIQKKYQLLYIHSSKGLPAIEYSRCVTKQPLSKSFYLNIWLGILGGEGDGGGWEGWLQMVMVGGEVRLVYQI